LLVAALDALRELHLFGGGEELVAAGLVQEELKGVGRRNCEVAVDVRVLHGIGTCAVVREHDAALFELLEEAGGLIVVELGLREKLADCGEVEAAELLALLQQDRKSVVQARRM